MLRLQARLSAKQGRPRAAVIVRELEKQEKTVTTDDASYGRSRLLAVSPKMPQWDANNSKTGQALQTRSPISSKRAHLLQTASGSSRAGNRSKSSSIRSSTVMMTIEKAQKIIEAGIAKAKQIRQPMNIAVVDAGANLTAFARMDGAWLGSIDIAINKAFTAKAFDISTLELGRNSQPKDQFFGIHVSNHARVMIFAGGIPIKMNGQIVGAVGVSGGSGEQDQAVAEAVVAASS
jgi:uncharacterized protein GlcG (DUF336 family)